MTTQGKATVITVTAEQRVRPGKEAKPDGLMDTSGPGVDAGSVTSVASNFQHLG
jgi:hypothetical protein